MDSHDIAGPTNYHELAKREAPALGMPVSALYKNLRRTGGDLEAAVSRYLENVANHAGRPVAWDGRSFPTRQAFVAWLAGELGIPSTTAQGQLYQHKWDIAATIASFQEDARRREAAEVVRRRSNQEEEAAAVAAGELALLPELTPGEEPAPALDLESELAPMPELTSPGSQARTPDEGPEPALDLESELALTPELTPQLCAPRPAPRGRGARGTAVPVLYGGTWFESKKALARHLDEQGVLSATDVLCLLYPPVTEDLRPRLDYFVQRVIRLDASATGRAPGPLIYAGRLYTRRGALLDWLVEQIDASPEQASAALYALDGDVTAEVEDYCRAFGYAIPPPDPEAFPLPIAGAPGNGHAGNGAAPAPETSVFPAAPGSEPAIAGPLGMIATAFDAQQAELAILRQRHAGPETHADPAILRELQACNATLDRLAARLQQLERTATERHRDIADQADKIVVILHKVGQLTHDFEQMRNRGAPVPRHTRKRPLGVE